MDLSNMSISELRSLHDRAEQEIKARQNQEVAKAREQILAIAQSVGIPIDDLVRSSKPVKVPKKAAVQYRHPENASLEWTGRGRQPHWVKAWVDEGKSIDALKI
jgi:DNA-binding protein H-NS